MRLKDIPAMMALYKQYIWVNDLIKRIEGFDQEKLSVTIDDPYKPSTLPGAAHIPIEKNRLLQSLTATRSGFRNDLRDFGIYDWELDEPAPSVVEEVPTPKPEVREPSQFMKEMKETEDRLLRDMGVLEMEVKIEGTSTEPDIPF